MNFKAWTGVVATAVAGAIFAAPALAQFKKPEDAIEYRQSAFTVMGAHFGRIGAVVKGAAPFDAAKVANDAMIVETLSKLPFAAFGPGTETGHHTEAKPEIWSERADFDKAAQDMQMAVAELAKVAAAGDEAGLKAAFGAAGKTCKGCHDKFRSK